MAQIKETREITILNVKITGDFMSTVSDKSINLVVLYRLLKLLKEKGSMKMNDLYELYKAKYNEKPNYNIIKRHIDYAKYKKLVELEGAKPKKVKITSKGTDYIFLILNVERLLDEHIG